MAERTQVISFYDFVSAFPGIYVQADKVRKLCAPQQ